MTTAHNLPEQVPTEDGHAIEWNGVEKFYSSAEWMAYLIEHFLGPIPKAKAELPFQQTHTLNGDILAQGEEISDRWKLIVKDGHVSVSTVEVCGVVECPECGHKWEAA
jgi:hypothetical protein